jgi:hypothetical protein
MARMRTARTAIVGWVALPLALALAAGGADGAPDGPSLPERVAEAKARLARDLLGVARWAVGEGLDGSRERTLGLVLELDPRNVEALRALGWRRPKQKGEAWTPPVDRPPAEDARPARVPAWRERWDAAFSALRDALLPHLDEGGGSPSAVEARGEALALLRRGLPGDADVLSAVDALVAPLRDPKAHPDAVERLDDLLEARFADDERVRAARGHVRGERGWTLAESERARARRPRLAAAVAEALAAPAAVRGEPTEAERVPGLEGLRAWVAPSRDRVVGTVEDAALALVAHHLDRSARVVDLALGPAAEAAPPVTCWQVRDLAEARRMVAAYGGEARLLEEMGRYSSLPLGPVELVWGGTTLETERRLDAALFGAHTRHLRARHGLGGRYAGFSEGLVRWLVWRQAGTRLSSVLDRQYSDPLAGAGIGSLATPTFDWAKAASAFLEPAKNRGALRLALGKRTETQTAADAVVCYAFAAYLVEGNEAVAGRLATRLGRDQNDDLDAAFVETLGRRVEQVERRLSRWCRETGP